MKWAPFCDNMKRNQESQGALMTYIVDKIILILLTAFLLYSSCSIDRLVIYLLVGIIFACLNGYFENKRILIISGVMYVVALIFVPELILIVPIFCYDLFGQRLYILEALIGLILLGAIDDIGLVSIFFLLVIALLAHIMYYKSNRNETLSEQIKHIRDDSEERNILLAEKNKHLIERQDQDIYVATLKERNRIARDIHDNVGHMITRSILQMGALMTINKQEPLHGQLESVKNNLDVAMNNIRESVHDLHDESIDLKQAISDLTDEIKDSFECSVDYDIGDNVDRKYKYAIIGIVREAVSNIIKHSKSDSVDIIIREHPGMYQLIIYDYVKHRAHINTVDATKNIGRTDGIGLQNMQDRVKSLRGNISIDESNGYKIFVTFPK